MPNFTYFSSQSFRTLTHWQSGGRGEYINVNPWFNLAVLNGKNYTLPMNFTTGSESHEYEKTRVYGSAGAYEDVYAIKGTIAPSMLTPVKVLKTDKGTNEYGYVRGVLKFGNPETCKPYSIHASGEGPLRITNVTDDNLFPDNPYDMYKIKPHDFTGDAAFNVILPIMQKYVIVFTKFTDESEIPYWLKDKITGTDNTYQPSNDILGVYRTYEDQIRLTEAARIVPASTFYHTVKVPKGTRTRTGRYTEYFGAQSGVPETYVGGLRMLDTTTYASAGMRNEPNYRTWFGVQQGMADACLGFTPGTLYTDLGVSQVTYRCECEADYINMGFEYNSRIKSITIYPFSNFPTEGKHYIFGNNTLATMIYEVKGYEFRDNVLQITR